MKSETNSAGKLLSTWARRQLADYDARQPGSLFAEGLALDVEQAYRLQTAVAELRVARGERLVGYKVGCTSPAIRRQLGIEHCVSGRLWHTEQHVSGVRLSIREFANLAIEGELAVELRREPLDADFAGDSSGIPPCVARVFPVIELHHQVLRGRQPAAAELIAHNAIHAGFVAGTGAAVDGEPCPGSLAILANDQQLEECAGPPLTATIRTSLQWLATHLRARGERLEAGQLVLTGSLPRLIPLRTCTQLRVDAPPFGSVAATFYEN